MYAFVSDVHLTEPHTKKYEVFLRFLEACKEDAKIKEVFLVGDVFDLWLGHKSFFLEKHKDLLIKLEELAQEKKVHIFEGNHDFHFKKSWWRSKGIEIHKEAYRFQTDSKKWHVSHGDLLNKKDYGYRLTRRVFRSYFVQFLIWLLPGKTLYKIGDSLSTTDAKESSGGTRYPSKKKFLMKWENWLLHFLKKNPVDIFICGHYHVRLIEKVGKTTTVNLGSWLGSEESFQYLITDGETFEFLPASRKV